MSFLQASDSKFAVSRHGAQEELNAYTGRYLPFMEFHDLSWVGALKTSADTVRESVSS
jgi:hypothetical protein